MKVDKALNTHMTIDIIVLNESTDPPFHGFSDAHFLLINRLDLDEFVSVVKLKHKRKEGKIKVLTLFKILLELLDRLEGM